MLVYVAESVAAARVIHVVARILRNGEMRSSCGLTLRDATLAEYTVSTCTRCRRHVSSMLERITGVDRADAFEDRSDELCASCGHTVHIHGKRLPSLRSGPERFGCAGYRSTGVGTEVGGGSLPCGCERFEVRVDPERDLEIVDPGDDSAVRFSLLELD